MTTARKLHRGRQSGARNTATRKSEPQVWLALTMNIYERCANYKDEIRNKFKTTNPNFKTTYSSSRDEAGLCFWNFGFQTFGFVSDLVMRISDLAAGVGRAGLYRELCFRKSKGAVDAIPARMLRLCLFGVYAIFVV